MRGARGRKPEEEKRKHGRGGRATSHAKQPWCWSLLTWSTASNQSSCDARARPAFLRLDIAASPCMEANVAPWHILGGHTGAESVMMDPLACLAASITGVSASQPWPSRDLRIEHTLMGGD